MAKLIRLSIINMILGLSWMITAPLAALTLQTFTLPNDPLFHVPNNLVIERFILDQPPLLAPINAYLTHLSVEQADQQAIAWLEQYIDELHNYFKGQALARQYLIKKLPAIVFNSGEVILYGVTDITQALMIYHQSQTNETIDTVDYHHFDPLEYYRNTR